MTDTQRKVVDGILVLINSGEADKANFTLDNFISVNKATGCRIPWKFFEANCLDKKKVIYDFSNLVAGDVPSPAPTPMKKSSGSAVKSKQDVKILDKYTDKAKKKTSLFPGKETVIVVSDPDDGYVIGVTRKFSTAWGQLKTHRFHDHGEFTDMAVAEKVFLERGVLVLKSKQFDGFCMFEQQEVK